ncbi:MAG: serine/threonine-protein kinase [Deltaproteobacteria bacterium]
MPFTFGPFQMLVRVAVRPTTQRFLALVATDDGPRPVIVETLLAELSAKKEARRTFSNEAQIATRLEHPSCVAVEEWGAHEGICWISTQFYPGETFARLLEASEWRLPASEVVGVIAELCVGLNYAHELSGSGGPYDIVHRGISTTNLMLGDDGRPRILDFGTGKSRIVHDATETGFIKGSFKYMSPEQLLGKELDRRTDIYSLAEVLFEALARQPPTGGGLDALAIAKLDGHPRLKDVQPDAHPDLDRICAKALTVEPKDRFASAADFGTALVDYIDTLQRKPTRKTVKELMRRTFGNRIELRARVLDALVHGEYDEGDVCRAFDAEPAKRRHVFSDAQGGYDEAAFLATIKPGVMHVQTPMKPQAARPAKARIELRAPKREPDEPQPPTEIHAVEATASLLDADVLQVALVEDETAHAPEGWSGDDALQLALAEAEAAHDDDDDALELVLEDIDDVQDPAEVFAHAMQVEDASTEDDDDDLHLPDLLDDPSDSQTMDGDLEPVLEAFTLPAPDGDLAGGRVDPEPTGIFFKPKKKKK